MNKISSTRKNKKIPESMIRLGQHLKNLREELGFSMHEVSRRSGLTPSYISKIESARIFKSINIQALVSFSKIYGIPVNVILEKVGFLDKQEDQLPGLASYLRIKYGASYQAIRDMEIAWEVIQKKYSTKSSGLKSRSSLFGQESLWE